MEGMDPLCVRALRRLERLADGDVRRGDRRRHQAVGVAEAPYEAERRPGLEHAGTAAGLEDVPLPDR